MYLMIGIGVLVLVVLFVGRQIIGGMLGLYRIVPVNEAHIRIMRDKKEVFSSRTNKSSYWFIPFITKLHKLPLCNLAIPINDIKLNDKNMAKFVCDIMCFVNIDDINLAVERLTLTDLSSNMGFDFVKLSEDLRAILESVGRTVTTKQTIIDIYMNRQLLDTAITKEVEAVFPKWGIKLVDLELKDIKDVVDSSIIKDIERKAAAEIRRDADIKVAETTKEAEMVKASNEEEYRKRQIQKDQAIGIADQLKNQEIHVQAALANAKLVEATRVREVGVAEIERQKVEKLAEAKKIQLTTEAEGESNKIKTIGESEANIIKVKKLAEAEGTLKLAEAMKQFNDTAINVKVLDIMKEIQISKFKSLSEGMAKADIKWIMSGQNANKFFGMDLNAEGGANLEQFLKESNLDLGKVLDQVKGALGAKKD